MIIKKKKKKLNNDEKAIYSSNQPSQATDEHKLKSDLVKEKNVDKDDDEFGGINLDEIDFEQREERRRGDRRRGYRRIDERNLVSRAHEEANLIKKQAFEDGYNEGVDSAKNDLTQFKDALNAFYQAKEDAYDKLSDDILSISLEIAKKIIKTELETNKEIIKTVINEEKEKFVKTLRRTIV